MGKETETDGLIVIANLLALQVTKDMGNMDAAWLLRKAGMKNAEIGSVLGISAEAAGAHVSNKRKQLEKTTKKASKPRKKKVEDE